MDADEPRAAIHPLQRRLRHIRGIYLRNLDVDDLVNVQYRVWLDVSTEILCVFPRIVSPTRTPLVDGQTLRQDQYKCLFESDVHSPSLNPAWHVDAEQWSSDSNKAAATSVAAAMDLSLVFNKIKSFVVQMLKAPGAASAVASQQAAEVAATGEDTQEKDSNEICSEMVNLEHLVYVGPNVAELQLNLLPLNCLLLECVDGVFITLETFLKLKIGTVPSAECDPLRRFFSIQPQDTGLMSAADVARQVVSSGEVETTLARFKAMRAELCAADASIRESRTQIEEFQNNNRSASLLDIQVAQTKARLARLREQTEQKRAQISMLQLKLDDDKSHLEVEKLSFELSQQMLFEEKKKLKQELREELQHEREQLAVLAGKCTRRQRSIIKHMQLIYPIAISPKGSIFTINGLSIYRGETQLATDDEAASALGYAAHVVRMVSKLLQIPLKYQVYPLASKSLIQDEAAPGAADSQKILLPLYLSRSSERAKYVRAVMLLNLDIYHMGKVRGIKAKLRNKADILENLKALLDGLASTALSV